jgi:predicted flap endonuclease-1-like 5' DNA nuclease
VGSLEIQLIALVVAFLGGLIIGWLVWGHDLASRKELTARSDEMRLKMIEAGEARTQAERQLASARDQVRPLADEVDKLRRDLDSARKRLSAAQAALAEPSPREAPAPGPSPAVPSAPEVSAAAAVPTAPPAAQAESARAPAPPTPAEVAAPLAPGAPVAVPPAAAPAPAGSPPLDDLRILKGVGDKLAVKLRDRGISSVPELAALPADVAQKLDRELDQFSGRIARDQLVEQAQLLSEGRITEYEARYGKLSPPA